MPKRSITADTVLLPVLLNDGRDRTIIAPVPVFMSTENTSSSTSVDSTATPSKTGSPAAAGSTVDYNAWITVAHYQAPRQNEEYIKQVRQNGEVRYLKETTPGGLDFNTPVQRLPAGAEEVRRGERVQRQFIYPADTRKIRLQPVGLPLSEKYKLASSYVANTGWEECVANGIRIVELGNVPGLNNDAAVAASKGKLEIWQYLSEQGVVPEYLRYENFCLNRLDAFCQEIYKFLGLNGYVTYTGLNIERCVGLFPPQFAQQGVISYIGGIVNQAQWDSTYKNIRIKPESYSGPDLTLEELFQQKGIYGYLSEMETRWVNRQMALRMIVYKKGASNGMKFLGEQYVEGFQYDMKEQNWRLPYRTNIRHFTGGSDTVTFPDGSDSVTIPSGKMLHHVGDLILDYQYPGHIMLTREWYDKIFNPATRQEQYRNWETLWRVTFPNDISHVKTRILKHYYLVNNTDITGGAPMRYFRMTEHFYEAAKAIIVDPNGYFQAEVDSWVDWGMRPAGPYANQPEKVYYQPGFEWAMGIISRFYVRDGGKYHWSGFGMGDDPTNQEWPKHQWLAALQAIHDTSPLEAFFDNCTRHDDAEIRWNNAWIQPDAVAGQQSLPGGGYKIDNTPQVGIHHWTTQGRTIVCICASWSNFPFWYNGGDFNNGTRTFQVRVPGNGLNGTQFEVTIKGVLPHLYTFSVPAGGDGEVWRCDHGRVVTPGREGYGGLVTIV